ncbi:MAG TPA: hypothetical protein VGJ06_20795 [Candidatus Acidoferrum sp.]|jgi:hypothetical protein
MLKSLATLISALALACGTLSAHTKPKPHYTFILPDGYIGWVQIIFNDPQASPLPIRTDGGRAIEVPESGISRTSDFRVSDIKAQDEFFYRLVLPNGSSELHPMPSSLFLPGEGHGGWGVRDTGCKGRGSSWFVFFGPREVRAKIPGADITKEPGYGKKLMAPDVYPTPGRLPASSPSKP